MKTIQTAAYEVSDLENFPEVKKRVLEKHFETNIYDGFFDEVKECFIDTFKETEQAKNWLIERIFFSGFGSQGDGAMFEGSYIDENTEIFFTHDNGRYYHENSFNAEYDEDKVSESQFQDIKNEYQSICKSIYKFINESYDNATTEDAILQTLEANEYLFNENGDIVNQNYHETIRTPSYWHCISYNK